MVTSFLLLSIIMAGLALSAWRHFDHRADREAMNRLASVQPARPACFDPAMIADLPEPARRYFLYTIEPGTTLYTVANITMAGRFGMGTMANPTISTWRRIRPWPCLTDLSGKCTSGVAKCVYPARTANAGSGSG